MTTEMWLFLIVGAVSIAAAVMMLISENAVHSALFLILNLAAVAFLFLLLDAPFLTVIQIAVYAGAIMVLFLFVIMLLGAERVEDETDQPFPWMMPLGMGLAVVFLLATSVGVMEGAIQLQPPLAGRPQLRIAHAAPQAGTLDIFIDGELVAENVVFADAEASKFIELEAGEHAITLAESDTGEVVLEGTLALAADEARSALVLSENEALTLQVIADDLNTPAERTRGRLVFFNAFDEAPAVRIVDLGADRTLDIDEDSGEITDAIIIDELGHNRPSDPLHVDEGEITTWAVLAADTNNVLYRLNRPELFTVERNTSELIVITGERQLDGALRAVAVPFASDVRPRFGGPESVGALLFSAYLLPFELVSVLLLVAMVGAILLTQRVSVPVEQRKRHVRRRVSRPLTSVIAAQTGQATVLVPPEAPAAAQQSETSDEEPEAQRAGD